jgi:hypothetical protein
MVKQTHYRLGQALRVPGFRGFQISLQSAYEGGQGKSAGRIAGTNFCWRLSELQGHSAAGRIMAITGLNHNIGNPIRTKDNSVYKH